MVCDVHFGVFLKLKPPSTSIGIAISELFGACLEKYDLAFRTTAAAVKTTETSNKASNIKHCCLIHHSL
jgi:hypothetical protein